MTLARPRNCQSLTVEIGQYATYGDTLTVKGDEFGLV